MQISSSSHRRPAQLQHQQNPRNHQQQQQITMDIHHEDNEVLARIDLTESEDDNSVLCGTADDISICTSSKSSPSENGVSYLFEEFGPSLLVCPKNLEFGNAGLDDDVAVYIQTTDALAQKVVLVYFGASWCPPCNAFTPMLTEFYKRRKSAGDDFEVVFVSLDNSVEDFESTIKSMPWLCVPFEHLSQSSMGHVRKLNLQRTFKVDGMPHLVVVSPKGKIRSYAGVEELEDDPYGAKFPWYKSLSQIWPKKLIKSNGELVDPAILDKKYILLYFSACWSQPCQKFSPTLVKFYQSLKEARDDFEVILVSSDRDAKAFEKNFKDLPFLALPFDERETKSDLAKYFGISRIPTTLILSPVQDFSNGRPVRSLINDRIREFIEGGKIEDFPFSPQAFSDISLDADGIYDNRCLIIFHEYGSSVEQNAIIRAISDVSETCTDRHTMFFYALRNNGIVPYLREALNIDSIKDRPVMVIMDIPDDGAFYVSSACKQVTKLSISKFLRNSGERHQLA